MNYRLAGLFLLATIVIICAVLIVPADSLFILFLGLLGFPAVRATLRGQFRILQSIRGATFQMRIKIFLAFTALVITALGVYAFLMVFTGELYVQLTCKGAACAQGGIGVLMVTPIVWISYGITYAVAKFLFNGKYLPLLASPNF